MRKGKGEGEITASLKSKCQGNLSLKSKPRGPDFTVGITEGRRRPAGGNCQSVGVILRVETEITPPSAFTALLM